MKYAIIENEEFARINLRETVKTVRPDYILAFAAETIEESLRYLSKHNDIDLIFMDVELDDGNCFEIFNRIEVKIPVIFTTAYDEYAVRAFKVNSVDYLLKPVSEEELETSIIKFEERNSVAHDYRQLAESIPDKKIQKRFLISDGAGYSFVHAEEIAWFEAEDKYVSIRLKSGKSLFTDYASLSDLTHILDPELFFQISRSVISSISAITKIDKYYKGRLQVKLQAGSEHRTETVSAARRPEFLEWLGHSGK